MSDEFNPYRKWFGIPLAEQPPDHYRLLGVDRFETSADAIENAAFGRMALLKTFAAGPQSAASQRLLNEVAAAKLCLLHPSKRRAYDQQLRGDEASGRAGGETEGQADAGSPKPLPTAAAPQVSQTLPELEPLPADDLFAEVRLQPPAQPLQPVPPSLDDFFTEVPLQRSAQPASPGPQASPLQPLQPGPWPVWLRNLAIAGGIAVAALVALLVILIGTSHEPDLQPTNVARADAGDSGGDDGPDDSTNVTPKVPPDVPANQGARGANWSYKISGGALAVGFSPDGKYLAATATWDGTFIWELATGSARKLSHVRSNPARIDFTPQGHLLVGNRGGLHVFDPETGMRVDDWPRPVYAMYGLSPDGRFIPARAGRSLALFETATGQRGPLLADAYLWIVAIAFSADGRFLAMGMVDSSIKVLDYKTLESVHQFAAQEGRIESLEFAPDGALLVAAVHDRALRCWNVADWSRRWNSEGRGLSHPAFAPDGRTLASTDFGACEVQIRRPDDGTVLSRIDVGRRIADVDFSADGRLLAIACSSSVQIRPVTPDAQLPPAPQRPR